MLKYVSMLIVLGFCFAVSDAHAVKTKTLKNQTTTLDSKGKKHYICEYTDKVSKLSKTRCKRIGI